MNLAQLFERSYYRKNHTCNTPDAVYSTKIAGDTVSVSIKLPFQLELSKDKCKKLEADLHYAIEKLLAPLFK